MWLDITGVVKGFYLPGSHGEELELYPVVYNTAQVPGTAWRVQGEAVDASAEEREKLAADEGEAAVVIRREILPDRNLLVGLILADGTTTPGMRRCFIGRCLLGA